MSWAYWLSVRPKTYLCPQTKTLLFYSSLSGVGVIGSLQITYQVSLKVHQYPCIFLGEKMHFESKSHSCFLLEITNKIAPNVWLKPIPLNLKSYTLTFWFLQLQPNRPASKSFFEEIWEKSVMITRHLILAGSDSTENFFNGFTSLVQTKEFLWSALLYLVMNCVETDYELYLVNRVLKRNVEN